MQKLIILLLFSLTHNAFAAIPMIVPASTMGELGIFSLISLSAVMAVLALRFIKYKNQSDD